MEGIPDEGFSINIDVNQCLICQSKKSSSQKLSTLGVAGRATSLAAAEERQEAHDATFSQAIARIIEVLRADAYRDCSLQNHKGCYATFTSKSKIEALTQDENKDATPGSSQDKHFLRSTTGKYDKKKCIFCQKDTKEKLRLVQTNNMNATILDLSKCDYMVNIRVGDMVDLIAADVMYHSTCLILAKRIQEKLTTEHDSDKRTLPFVQICKELRVSASLQKVCSSN